MENESFEITNQANKRSRHIVHYCDENDSDIDSIITYISGIADEIRESLGDEVFEWVDFEESIIEGDADNIPRESAQNENADIQNENENIQGRKQFYTCTK